MHINKRITTTKNNNFLIYYLFIINFQLPCGRQGPWLFFFGNEAKSRRRFVGKIKELK